MRPVNLIPPEEQRGERSPMRTGALSYVLIGALALGLVMVTVLALTSKGISDKNAEKQQLEQELTAATAKAESLRAFADFRAVQETRTATVASLAESRFDWTRVLNELSRVIPGDVWLVNLTGSASPDVTIDGVTRVGIQSSSQPDQATAGITGGAVQGTTDDCRTRSFIYQFELVVAFDAVPPPAAATTVPSVPAPLAPGSDSAQLTEVQAQQQAATASATEQTAKAEQAKNTFIPGN